MHESVVFKRFCFLLKGKRSQHSTSCGNMNLDSSTAWEEEREGLTRRCLSVGLCDLFRQLSTVLARRLYPHFLDNDILSLQTGRVLSPSTLFFFLSHLFLNCFVMCPATWGLSLWLKSDHNYWLLNLLYTFFAKINFIYYFPQLLEY